MASLHIERWATVAFLLVAGGCLQSPAHGDDPAPPTKPFEIQERDLSRAAPYATQPHPDLEKLNRFLQSVPFGGATPACPWRSEPLPFNASNDIHFEFLGEYIGSCWAWQEIGELMGSLASDGARAAHIRQTINESRSVMLSTYGALSNHSVGSVVDYEVLALFQRLAWGVNQFLDSALHGLEQAKKDPTEDVFVTTMMNALGPQTYAERIAYVLDEYPWQAGICTPPADLWSRIEMKLAKLDAAASYWAEPDEAEWLSEPLGLVRRHIEPALADYQRRNWPAAAMLMEVTLDHQTRFNQYRGLDEFPPASVVQDLLEQERQPATGLSTEYLLRSYQDLDTVQARKWERDAWLPPNALAALYQDWTFWGTTCIPAP